MRRAPHEPCESRTSRKRKATFGDHGFDAVESHDDAYVIGPCAGRVCYLTEGSPPDAREDDVAGAQCTFEFALLQRWKR
jgi:hypothetical protein